ncbi:MAG: GNAT family N-acetyltransferase [Acidimicrobiales bacterium]
MTIERLGPDDWSVWREVRLAALGDAPDAFGSTLDDWVDAAPERWRSRLADVPCNVIAWRDGVPVGQASGTERDEAGRIELISMWVDPIARGTATVDLLVDAVATWASDQQAQPSYSTSVDTIRGQSPLISVSASSRRSNRLKTRLRS